MAYQPESWTGTAVRLVLRDPGLTELWLDELGQMRERMRQVRKVLAETGVAGTVDLGPIGDQNGLFSVVPLSPDQVRRMREDHAIYMAGSGRINIAGLHMGNIAKFIEAVAKVSG